MGRKLSDYLENLLDEDGIKTDITLTIEQQTLLQLIAGMVIAGVSVLLIAQLFKVYFPNPQLTAILKQLKKTNT